MILLTRGKNRLLAFSINGQYQENVFAAILKQNIFFEFYFSNVTENSFDKVFFFFSNFGQNGNDAK